MTCTIRYSLARSEMTVPFEATTRLPADEEVQLTGILTAGGNTVDDPITLHGITFEPALAIDNLVDVVTVAEADRLVTCLNRLNDTELSNLVDYFLGKYPGFQRIPGDEIINLSYHMDELVWVNGIYNDADLGNFLLENDMFPEAENMPEALTGYLNLEKIGREHRLAAGGVFTDGYYVENPNGPENLRTPYVRTVTKPEEERMLSVVMTAGQWQRLQSVLHQQMDETRLSVKEIQAMSAMDVQLREQTEPTEGLEIQLQ